MKYDDYANIRIYEPNGNYFDLDEETSSLVFEMCERDNKTVDEILRESLRSTYLEAIKRNGE